VGSHAPRQFGGGAQRVLRSSGPRLSAIIDYLNRLPLDSMPEGARRLLHLSLSLAEIAPNVELYKGSTTVPFSFEATRFIAVHGNRKD